MKTVLFIDKAEKDLWSTFQKYDYLIDEYRAKGSFAVCFWNRDGLSVDTAMPDLAAAVGSERDWQALIVTDLRLPESDLCDDEHFDNPFDFADRYDVQPGDGFVESRHPLVRLTQMLGGFPEKVFVDWKGVGAQVAELNDFDMGFADAGDLYDLIDRYRLGVPLPERVICVTPRDVDRAFVSARLQEFDARTAQRQRNYQLLVAERERALEAGDSDTPEFDRLEEQLRAYEREEAGEPLGFWERNDYPARARFVVIDRLAPSVETEEGAALAEAAKAKAFASDEEENAVEARSFWFDFWMCVLSLMVSTVMPEDLRAFEVYGMAAEIDTSKLQDSFDRRRAQWSAVCERIDERLGKDRSRLVASEHSPQPLPDMQVTIPVVFDLVKDEGLYTDPSEVRFLKDRPQNDLTVWGRQRASVLGEFRELLRAPRRALRMAADKFRAEKPVPYEELEYCVLNTTQKDRLSEEVLAAEVDLARGAGARAFNYAASEGDFDQANADVKRSIGARASVAQAFGMLAVGILTFAAGFVPYVVGTGTDQGVSRIAVLVAAGCCALLAVVVAFTLGRMRGEVRKAYLGFNDVMRRILGDLTTQASGLEQRVSGYASLRKKWSVLDRQEHLDEPTRESDRLQRCRALLNTRMRDIDEVARTCDFQVDSSRYAFDFTWDQVDMLLRDDSFYNIRDGAAPKMGFRGFDSGSFADAPYEFIARLDLLPLKVV